MKINVINKSKHKLPQYESNLASGLDLRANLDSSVILEPLERVLVPTGLFIELLDGYEAQIRPPSGLALKFGITVLNSPGTIDADYRGEIKILLINYAKQAFVIEDGERVAQMVVAKYKQIQWNSVEVLGNSKRGVGGFGSSGIK